MADFFDNNNGNDLDMVGKMRESNMNPAEFPPGQVNDPFSGIGGMQDPLNMQGTNNGTNNNDPFGGGAGYGSPLGNPQGSDPNAFNGFNTNPMGNGQPTSFGSDVDAVDKAIAVVSKAAVVGGKGLAGFLKRLIESMLHITPTYLVNWGRQICIGAVIDIVIGALIMFTGHSGYFLPICVSSFFLLGVGTMLFMFNYSKYREERQGEVEQEPEMESEPVEEPEPELEPDFTGMEDFNEGGESSLFDDDDDDLPSVYGYEDEDEDENFVPDAPMTNEEALNSLPEVNKGMYTRQYLYEMLTKVLPSYAPSFAEFEEYDENDDLFLTFQEAVTEAAEVMGIDEENSPNVLSVSRNMFVFKIITERSAKLKAQQLADEVANIYADRFDCEDAYALSKTVGRQCIITLFPGDGDGKVSLLDCMTVKKDFFLNTKNYLPVVLGVDESGKVIAADLKKLDSMFITGMPRSGKSWFAKLMLLQMCAFCSPSELNFYICDPKDGVSDFKTFAVPHVKKFVTADDEILKLLRWVVKTEGVRRKKLLGDAGCINIWSFKDKCPNVKLPLLYVVVDEVVTLSERMDKETKAEFQGLITELVSQLPNLGIRLMMVPHVIKNDIIKKTASDLVPCRISVRGDEAHIESSCGLKPKEFPYKLVSTGDMAVKLKLDNFKRPLFVHACIIADNDEKIDSVFEYMRCAWERLEPEEESSVSSRVKEEKYLGSLEDKVSNESADWMDADIFEDDDEGMFKDEDTPVERPRIESVERPKIELNKQTGSVSLKKPANARVVSSPKKEQASKLRDEWHSPEEFLGLDDIDDFNESDLFDD